MFGLSVPWFVFGLTGAGLGLGAAVVRPQIVDLSCGYLSRRLLILCSAARSDQHDLTLWMVTNKATREMIMNCFESCILAVVDLE